MNAWWHVPMELRLPLVCGNTYDNGGILLDMHLCAVPHNDRLGPLCVEHQKLFEEDFRRP